MNSRAIVVEDDAASAAVLAKLLGRLGCSAVVCTDPQAAVELALGEDVDFVSLDLTMPQLNGYQVLTLIRSYEHTRRSASVPVITVTGRVTAEDKADALASGFAAHLGKPVLLEELKEALDRALTLRSDLHRTRYTVDREAIERCVRGLRDRAGEGRLESAAGLALAVEQEGRDLLRQTLALAFSGNVPAALERLKGLDELARAIGGQQLQFFVAELAARLPLGHHQLGRGAVLLRAELDRVIYTLREQVLG